MLTARGSLPGDDSNVDSVSRSSTMACMRWACSYIMSMYCSRCSLGSASSGMSRSVSRKPASTVSGVRNSCDTLATKSRRVVSRRSIWVTSRVMSRRWLLAYAVSCIIISRSWPCWPSRTRMGSGQDGRCAYSTNSGARSRFSRLWPRSAGRRRPRCWRAMRLHQSIWKSSFSVTAPSGRAWAAASIPCMVSRVSASSRARARVYR